MSNIVNYKAFVLDDNPKDAWAVIQALSRLGIGSVYSGGKKRDAPKVSGIRLIILDFSLSEGLSTEDQVSDARTKIFEKLKEDNGPFVILGWTRMIQSEADRFVEYYNETSAEHSYVFKSVLRKKDYETNQGHNTRKLSGAIKDCLRFDSPLNFLFDWEKHTNNAASVTVNSIGEIASQGIKFKSNLAGPNVSDREVWRLSLLHLMRNLSRKLYGDSIRDGELAIKSFCEILDPVLLDRVESESAKLVQTHKETGEEVMNLRRDTPPEMKTELESEILGFHHTSSAINHYKTPRPGDVFEYRKSMLKLKPKGCHVESFLAHSSRKDLYQTFFKGLNDDHRKTLNEEAKRVLLDITPVCDYQRRLKEKISTSRFVVGLIAPSEMHSKCNGPDSNYVIGPLRNGKISVLKKDCILLFDFFRIVSLKLSLKKVHPRPLFRINVPLLSQIQTLFGTHALRQGILE